METENNTPVSFRAFSSITLIDILADKVSMFACKDKLELSGTTTYGDYLERLKKEIEPNDLNNYFDQTSLNKIKESNGECLLISYSKLSTTLSYDKYLDIVYLLPNDVICIFSVKGAIKSGENTGTVVSNKDELSAEVADLIYNIETIFNDMNKDSYEVKNSLTYIGKLMDDVKNKNTSVLDSYRQKVTLEVSKTNSSILITDDDPMMRNILKKVFAESYNIVEAQNGQEAIELLEQNYSKDKANLENPINIVGMFLDLKMPVMDGFGVLKYMQEHAILGKIPVIIISADDAKDTKEKIYNYDIADMIEKPFNYALIKKRIGKLINMYAKTNALKDIVRSKDTQIKKLLKGYSKAYLSDYTYINGTLRSAIDLLLTKYIEKKGGSLEIGIIADAAKYYDVGLNFIPKSYLNNIGSITDEQRQIVFNYPNVGANIINIVAEKKDDTFIKYAMEISKLHNERYDGRGFPQGLSENKIPMYMYLVNIAIDYAALKHTSMPVEDIKNTINSKSGNKFAPEAVELFNEVFDELKVID